jgi:prophage antirepressor-like protein
MNELQIFDYSGSKVRTVMRDGEPWFAAKDVCEILELGNSRMALERLDDDEKGVSSIDTLGGTQEMQIVNEPGLYSLVLGSRKPEAKAFKRWITHEVIPSVRKHGIYATDNFLELSINDPEYAITLLTRYKAERDVRKALEVETAQQKQIISELQPKASYYDLILQSSSVVPISQIAKDYGMSAKSFNKLLHELGVQFKLGNTWLLYQGYAEQGYTQSKTHIVDANKSVMHTYWTQKGRLFLYDLLKNEKGILPLIECEEGSRYA